MIKRKFNLSSIFQFSLFFLSVGNLGFAASEPFGPLYDTGSEAVIDYDKYGKFSGVGTEQYVYQVSDSEGLAKAAGEGVYPSDAHMRDAGFKTFLSEHPGGVDPWDFVDSRSPRSDLYAWCLGDKNINDNEGAKLFYRAEALRRSGDLTQAIKAYYSIVVHFPRSAIWSKDRSFYWYVAPEAIARIRKLCALHSGLGLSLEGAVVDIERSPDEKPESDRIRVSPGMFVHKAPSAVSRESLKITSARGSGKVRLVQYNDRFWELLVHDKPFIVKGITYTCTTVGESAHALNLRPWMTLDDDRNGKNDGMFDSWVDRNRNNRQDPDEPVVGDAWLLKEMGANTIRVYHGVDHEGNYKAADYDKELMRTLNRDFGLYFVLGDFLGAYTVGSGANWNLGTDYTDAVQQARMLSVVKAMVLDHKDEPYVLFWLLGNENQHSNTRTNAKEHPAAYARFVNEVTALIHSIDPDHPVAVCNFHTMGLKDLAQYAPEVDIYGANVYAGGYSFGSIWQSVKRVFGRPVLITEFGCPAYRQESGLDEQSQADYIRSNWDDIRLNATPNAGEGNAIGGILFEWMDEWWKSTKGNTWGDPQKQNIEGDFMGPFPGGWMHEEWLGVVGQGDGYYSHFCRQLRTVYETIKKEWVGTP